MGKEKFAINARQLFFITLFAFSGKLALADLDPHADQKSHIFYYLKKP